MARRTRRPALVAAPAVLVALVLGAVLMSLVARGGAWGAPDGAPTAAAAATAAAPASAPPRTPSAAPSTSGSALAVLATLAVKGKGPMTGYVRTARFGAAWLDVDRNGCDTRDDVLRRDLVDVTGSRCTVRSGVLHDPYTGRTIRFTRGEGTSTAVQIDHVVPLADAWRTGAQRLSQAKRIALANDPINLYAVDGPTNAQKSDGDAATWLPPSKAFRCTYIAHQVGVKRAYGLWVTPAEKAAMQRILTACPTTPAPVSRVAGLEYSGPGATTAPSTTAPSPSATTGAAVRAGAYCSPAGATGRTASGTAVVCRTSPTDARERWRSAA